MSNPITNRYEFAFLFDCENGNPNGDPDSGNAPRIDPQDMHGLVSDVAVKRRIRNYVQLACGNEMPNAIFVEQATNLNTKISKAHEETGGMPEYAGNKWKSTTEKAKAAGSWLSQNFFDVRAFGAVLSTGPNAGQIRGPVQIAWSRSHRPVLPLDLSITRMAVADNAVKGEGIGSADFQKWTDEQPEDELRTMGRKNLIPYGLYVGKGFVSAHLAQNGLGTGFSEDDLSLLWEAIANMFEHDRSSSKGLMSVRAIFIFKHEGTDNGQTNGAQLKRQAMLGCAPAHALFELIKPETDKDAPRKFDDYKVSVETSNLPAGVRMGFVIPACGPTTFWDNPPEGVGSWLETK